jgi:hypothetical protein
VVTYRASLAVSSKLLQRRRTLDKDAAARELVAVSTALNVANVTPRADYALYVH